MIVPLQHRQNRPNRLRRRSVLIGAALVVVTGCTPVAPTACAPVPMPASSAPAQAATTLLPAKFVAGYLEAYDLALPSTVAPGYDVLYHAFAPIAADGSTRIYTTNGVPRDQLAAEYRARRTAGRATILSIGGAGGAQSGLASAEHRQRFVDSVVPLIDEFGFAGIDWDLETGVPGGISVDGIVDVSRRLRDRYPGFIVTLAPYGAADIETAYQQIAAQLVTSGDLSYVGFQFYNDIAVPDAGAVLERMRRWMSATGITAEQFVIGLWYGPDEWQGLVTPHQRMVEIWDQVERVHPGIRGVFTWGVLTYDRPMGYPFASMLGAAVHS